MNTFAPDTPAHVLSDYTEERCHELGLPCARDDNGLTVTVPAKPNGLPDWETFLRVAHELQGADGWVMEGAKPWRKIASLSRACVEYSRTGGG